MAEKFPFFESLPNCQVCQETLTDPVSLTCEHSFCSKCLENLGEDRQSQNFPLCQRRSSMDIGDIVFALSQLSDSLDDRRLEPHGKTGSSTTGEDVKVELVCSKHKAKKMFCEDEQKAVCAVCEFAFHDDPKLVSLEEAVRGLKEQLKFDLKALKDKKKKYGEVEEKYRDAINVSIMQMSSTEEEIRAEYDCRRRLLKEEEESRVAALRNAEERKRKTVIREMEKVHRQMTSLSDSIDAVEEELQKDTMTFLNSYTDSQRRARAQYSQPDPQVVPYALMDMVEHLDSHGTEDGGIV